MKIYDNKGIEILDAPVTKSAVVHNELMADHYIELPFSLIEQVAFPRGSYVIYNGLKYKIKDKVNPDFDKKTGGYKYSLKFWSRQNDMKDAVVFWGAGPHRETSFHDTTTLGSFGNLIASSMNAFENGNDWKVAAVPDDLKEQTKLVSFNGDKCWNGINIIAETFDVEWWTVENGAEIWIHFGKLEFGTEETFRQGDAVKSIPARKGNDSEHGTRFYVFGSTRNIPQGYYDEDTGAPTNHIAEKMLHLPDGISFIDAWSPLAADDIIEQVAFFEYIYPKNTETVTSYETIKRKLEGTDDPSATFDAYVMHCEDTPFIPSDIFQGEKLTCMFTKGSLNGREFKLALINDDDSHTVIDPSIWKPEDGFNKKFEIIADQEDSGGEIPLIIPNASLHPEPGDTFILTGVRLPDERIKEAEQELLKAGKEWATKNSSDTNIYDCQTNPVYCHHHNKNYDLGQKVLLVDQRFGANGRTSRIQGFEKKLWNEFDATYTVGDNTAYSRLGNIEKNITEAAYAERIGVTNGVGIYVIHSKYDITQATDYNVYSALASDTKYLNRLTGGRVSGPVEFSEDIFSSGFRSGFAGAGFGITRNENGDWVLDIDKINIRKEAVFNSLVINQISFTAGETIFSCGGCEITAVETAGASYRCRYDNKDGRRYSGLVIGDQVRCQRYDQDQKNIIKYYWRLVTGIGDDYVELSIDDCDGTGVPEKGDNIVQFGHRTEISRQSAIAIDPLNGGSVILFAHINSYSLTSRQYVGFGVNPSTGEAYLYGHGDMYFGDRDIESENATFITYQKRQGDTKRRVYIQGSLTIGPGSSGLSNLSEWQSKQEQIDSAKSTADDTKNRLDNLKVGGRNLLRDTAVRLSPYSDSDNYVFMAFTPTVALKPNTEYVFSVDSTEILKGSGFNRFSVVIYNLQTNTNYGEHKVPISSERQSIIIKTPANLPQANISVLIYNGVWGSTAGKQIRLRRFKLEEGNTPTQWGAAPEEIAEEIDEAKTSAEAANSAVDDLNTYVDGAFKDGIIDEAEAVAIEKYRNSINETKKSADASYATVYGNALLTGSAKTNLSSAKTSLDNATAALLNSISTAIADKKTTTAEKADVDAKYANFNTAFGTYTTRLDEARKAIENAINSKADSAKALADSLQTLYNSLNDIIIPDLQNQIDGAIESWSGTAVPTLTNVPASGWTTAAEKDRHIGDYYDREVTTDGKKSYERYKFVKNGTAYSWQLIADDGGAKALAEAQKALGIANGKNKVFYQSAKPSAPYRVDDLWIKTDTGVMYISTAERSEGDTVGTNDWAVINDTALRLRQMSSDNVISREEKASLRNEWEQIQKEYTVYQSDATTYGVSITALTNAYNTLNTVLTGTVAIASDSDTTLTAAQRTSFNNAFAGWQSEVSRFQNAVAQKKADEAVANLKIGGRNLLQMTNRGKEHWSIVYNQVKLSLEEHVFDDGVRGVEIRLYDIVPNATNQFYVPMYKVTDILSRLKPNTGYMLSFDVVSTVQTGFHASIRKSNSQGALTSQLDVSLSPDALTHVSGAITTNSLASITNEQYYLYFSFDKKDMTLRIKNLKLEEGNKATEWTPAPEDADADIAQARAEAEAAQTAADEAKGRLDSWSSDSVISPTEKTALRQQQKDIQAEYQQTLSNATKYGVNTAAYTTAYNKANAALTKYTAATPEEIAVGGDYADIAAYYVARKTLMESIDAAVQAANGFRTTTLLDLTASTYDRNKYYLIKTPPLSQHTRIQFMMDALLREPGVSVPWATHDSKTFSAHAEWSAYASGWGAQPVDRIVDNFTWRFTQDNLPPVGSIGQIVDSSMEYIYVRGGGKYRFTAWGGTGKIVPTIFTSDYTSQNETVKSPIDSVSVPKTLAGRISDIDYIKEIFPTSTGDVGALLANMVGIKSGGSDVLALLNGGTFANDATHGKLVVAAGIPTTGDTLEQRTRLAKTRIYEDGTIDTSKLIARNGAKLGSFTIINNWLSANEDTSTYVGSGIRVKESLMYIHYKNGPSDIDKYEKTVYMKPSPNFDATLDFEGHSTTVYSGIGVETKTANKKQVPKPTPFKQTDIGFRATMAAENTGNNIGFYSDVSGGTNNYAFYAVNGLFAGLRPLVRKLTVNTTLTIYDHTIIVEKALTVTLPLNPPDGQEYLIYKNTYDRVVVRKNTDTSDKTAIELIKHGSASAFNIDLAVGILHIVFCAADNRWRMVQIAAA